MRLAAVSHWREFVAYPGSEQIASVAAIEGLMRWLQWCRPKSALEVGSGLGTLTAVLRDFCTASLWLVEPDPWCREQLTRHVLWRMSWWSLWNQTVALVPAWSVGLAPSHGFDFVVVDGGDRRGDYYAYLAPRAVVFFEGRRRPQRAVLEAMWRGRRRFAQAEWKPRDRSKGYWIYLFEPTLGERVWFGAVCLREWLRDALARLRGRAVGKSARTGNGGVTHAR